MFSTVGMIQRSLDFHQARQVVLVSNIAHVDTPGFTSKDMKRSSDDSGKGGFESQLGLAIAKTSGNHINMSGIKGDAKPVGDVINDPTSRKNGGVSLDREAAKAAANQIRYDVLTNLVSGSLMGLHEAAGDFK